MPERHEPRLQGVNFRTYSSRNHQAEDSNSTHNLQISNKEEQRSKNMNNGRRTFRVQEGKPAVLVGREHDGLSSGLCVHT